MKYAYYPGCSLESTAWDFDRSTRAVCSALDVELVEIPEADAALATSERYCLSYVNFYIANGAVIAPAYGAPSDEVARERLQDCFPDRDIVQVPIAAIAEGGAGYSCIAEIRMIETIETGKPKTAFLKFGDRVRIEMRDGDGLSIFGAIDHEVRQY